MSCDAFEALCFLYTQINKNTLLTEYKEFCKHFTKVENNIVIPKYLHDNEDLFIEDEMNKNSHIRKQMKKIWLKKTKDRLILLNNARIIQITNCQIALGVPENSYRSPQWENRDSRNSPRVVLPVFERTPQGYLFGSGDFEDAQVKYGIF